MDYTATLVLGVVLMVKYVMFDNYIDEEVDQQRQKGDCPAVMLDTHDGQEPITQSESNVTNWEQKKLEALTEG